MALRAEWEVMREAEEMEAASAEKEAAMDYPASSVGPEVTMGRACS